MVVCVCVCVVCCMLSSGTPNRSARGSICRCLVRIDPALVLFDSSSPSSPEDLHLYEGAMSHLSKNHQWAWRYSGNTFHKPQWQGTEAYFHSVVNQSGTWPCLHFTRKDQLAQVFLLRSPGQSTVEYFGYELSNDSMGTSRFTCTKQNNHSEG